MRALRYRAAPERPASSPASRFAPAQIGLKAAPSIARPQSAAVERSAGPMLRYGPGERLLDRIQRGFDLAIATDETLFAQRWPDSVDRIIQAGRLKAPPLRRSSDPVPPMTEWAVGAVCEGHLGELAKHLHAGSLTVGLGRGRLVLAVWWASRPEQVVVVTCAPREEDKRLWFFDSDGQPIVEADRYDDAIPIIRHKLLPHAPGV